jgi:hypothetical protein
VKLLQLKVWPVSSANHYYGWSVDFDVISRGASGQEITLEAALARAWKCVEVETKTLEVV